MFLPKKQYGKHNICNSWLLICFTSAIINNEHTDRICDVYVGEMNGYYKFKFCAWLRLREPKSSILSVSCNDFKYYIILTSMWGYYRPNKYSRTDQFIRAQV